MPALAGAGRVNSDPRLRGEAHTFRAPATDPRLPMITVSALMEWLLAPEPRPIAGAADPVHSPSPATPEPAKAQGAQTPAEKGKASREWQWPEWHEQPPLPVIQPPVAQPDPVPAAEPSPLEDLADLPILERPVSIAHAPKPQVDDPPAEAPSPLVRPPPAGIPAPSTRRYGYPHKPPGSAARPSRVMADSRKTHVRTATKPERSKSRWPKVAAALVVMALVASGTVLLGPRWVASARPSVAGVITAPSVVATAPFAGRIGATLVGVGAPVEAGAILFDMSSDQGVTTLPILAEGPGVVTRVFAAPGQLVSAGASVIGMLDCGALAVAMNPTQTARLGLRGGEMLEVAGPSGSVSLQLPAVLPHVDQPIIPLDGLSLQPAFGQACPVGQAVTVRTK